MIVLSMRSGCHENGEMIDDESEVVVVEGSEAIGMTENRETEDNVENRETEDNVENRRRQFRSQGEQIVEKEPIVYRRR